MENTEERESETENIERGSNNITTVLEEEKREGDYNQAQGTS